MGDILFVERNVEKFYSASNETSAPPKPLKRSGMSFATTAFYVRKSSILIFSSELFLASDTILSYYYSL